MTEDRVVSDTGPFAIVPEWVLYHRALSDRAVRLYGALARHADKDDGHCIPSRARLAKLLRCSAKSVDRCLVELIDAGCITKHARYNSTGDRTSNLYVVIRSRGRDTGDATPGQDSRHPRDTSDARGRDTGDAQNESHFERESIERKSSRALSPEAARVFDAFVQAIGKEPKVGRERTSWERASQELVDAGVPWHKVTWVARAWEYLGWDRTLTPSGVCRNWSTLEEEINWMIDEEVKRRARDAAAEAV